MSNNKRLTITDVAKSLGVTPRTIMRWEKAGKIKRSKRDWRGWRFYHNEDLDSMRQFLESAYDYDEITKTAPSLVNVVSILVCVICAGLLASSVLLPSSAIAETTFVDTTPGVTETPTSIDVNLAELPAINSAPTTFSAEDSVTYTLGPDDIIAITVRRHPEFSGEYAINSEGKIEYKFIGDITVSGLNKLELKEKLTKILSEFVVEPDVDVTIVAYLSKIFYVVGEVGRPGKFYMRGNTVTVRQALFQSGLPTYAAAMRRCRLITPDQVGKDNYKKVNVYKLLYEGDLKCNLEMKPGEVLYVPATVMAKMIRVISPVTGVAGEATKAAAYTAL
ncbi:polysaccharide biosynthesis/export family protein [Candidatus Omnitrophota bacterium]